MKRLCLLLVMVLLSQLCGTAFAVDKVTIIHGNFDAGGQPYTDWLMRQAERYTALHPNIAIQFVKISGAAQLTTLIAGGLSPDVTDGHTGIISALAGKGVFLGLDTLIAADPQVAPRNFIPSSVEDYIMNGVQWGLPGQAQPWITFYNEDKLKTAGLADPIQLGTQWTWKTFSANGKKLTRDENGDGTPENYTAWIPTDILRSAVWVRQAGGALFDKVVGGTKPTFTTPEVTVGWQYLQSLFTEHRVADPGSASKNWMSGLLAYNLRDANYHIGPLTEGATFSWDIARLPKGPANDTTAVGGAGFQIVNGSPRVKESFAWMKFLVTDKESARDFMQSMGRVSAYLPNAREYARIMQGVLKNINVTLEYMMETYVKPRDVNPYYSDVQAAVNPIVSRMCKGELSVQQAQEQAQQAAEVAMKLK